MLKSNAANAPWTAEGQEKRAAVKEMFAEIAPTYDLCNSIMSLALHRRWRACALRYLHLRPGDSVLDLCCGTGEFLIPLRKEVTKAGSVIGTDFCLPMLKRAENKQSNLLILGDAGRLPIVEQ